MSLKVTPCSYQDGVVLGFVFSIVMQIIRIVFPDAWYSRPDLLIALVARPLTAHTEQHRLGARDFIIHMHCHEAYHGSDITRNTTDVIHYCRSNTAPSERHPVAVWRNNLTALSQTRNLFFVAFLDHICVYTLDFPDQAVAGEPIGWIKLNASQPHLEGYIDEQLPQTANYITIKQFGDEEILLAACDSGDVIGHNVRAIEKALPQSSSPVTDTNSRYFYRDRSRQLFISPFFHENVGLSAWGVDVHSAARLIAVSSNTHNIVIFSFALSSSIEGEMEMLDRVEPPDDMLSSTRLSSKWIARPNFRSRDRNLVWGLLGHTDNIPHVSFFNGQNVDDNGSIYLASVDIYGVVQIWDVYKMDPVHTYSQAPEGWTATCMDPSNCRIANGFSPKPIQNWKSGSTLETYIQSLQEHDEEEREECTHDSDLELVPDSSSVSPSMAVTATEHSDELPTLSCIAAEQPTVTNEQQGWTESELGVRGPVIEPFRRNLTFNLLCTSKRGIHAIQCSSTKDRNQLNLNDPFGRAVPSLDRFQRLNMVESIPELGLVVIGNQAGEVALLTATYEPKEDRYTYELDAILPTEAQKIQKQKPESYPLMGISVGPVQGQLGTSYSRSQEAQEPDTTNLPRSERRYRLLLTYLDLTILSYDLSRVDTTTEILVI